MHVDEFIDAPPSNDERDNYAAWVLNHFRLPATLKSRFAPYMKQHKLFCTYEGKRYRVTGASRMGDVWLSENFNEDIRYSLRVDIAKCTEWSDVAAVKPAPRGSADSTLDMQAIDPGDHK